MCVCSLCFMWHASISAALVFGALFSLQFPGMPLINLVRNIASIFHVSRTAPEASPSWALFKVTARQLMCVIVRVRIAPTLKSVDENRQHNTKPGKQSTSAVRMACLGCVCGPIACVQSLFNRLPTARDFVLKRVSQTLNYACFAAIRSCWRSVKLADFALVAHHTQKNAQLKDELG